MNTVYSLKFSNQIFPFNKKVEIYHSKINNNSAPKYFVFLDGKLYRYTFENFNWHENLLLNAPTPTHDKVLYFPRILKDDKSLLLLKNKEGIDFYRYKDNKFNILLRSNEYERYGNWGRSENIIKCGNFYFDKNYIGILSKNEINGLQFHIVIEDQLRPHKIPIFSLQEKNLEILKNVDTSNAYFFLADLKRKGQENVIIRNRSGLNIYEFDEENKLHHFRQVPESSKPNDFEENLFFPDLTGQPLKDIVLFNTSGLFVYQYNVKQENYQIIHYNPLFDAQRGWNDKYIHTIRFEDINLDGKQEMFFTGPQGMDILTFDNYTFQWQSLLDISGITVPKRHSNVVEVVSRSSVNSEYPAVFTQHQNEMYWAQIVKKPVDNDFEDEVSEEIPTDVSTTLSVIPELMKSEIGDEDKTNILLRDQLDFSSIINGVDKDTGKASFKLPLIGLPNFSNDEKINLHYNGNNKDSSVLGIGWSFPINAIMMDHHGSIFPENESYYLILEDFPQYLIFDSDNSTDYVYNFKLSEQKSKTRIRYFKLEERWEIDYKETKQIYGRRKDSSDESISYDLAWKYWRGRGSGSSGQVEIATAWFLIEIRSGPNSAIHYTYDITNLRVPESGKKFTQEIHLKTISDNEGNQIIFYYAAKNPEEFILPPLKDADGSYNTKKVETHYLTAYSITTYNYRQDIGFVYNVDNGNRLLTKIVQKNYPSNEAVLEFSYKLIINSYLLEQVILPTAASVKFSYEIIGGIDISNSIQKVDLTCQVRNSYRVDYGQDFVLISYLNNFKHVVLKMYNRELTNEMYSSTSDSESKRFPFFGEKSVLYYEVKILEESLAIILDYGENKDLCLMHKEKDKWTLNPKCYNYDKNSIIQMGNDFIAVLDAPKLLLEIIVWDKKSNEWAKEKMDSKLIENSTDSLVIASGKVFFIYDDNIVTVGYRNKNKWQSKTIIILPEVIRSIRNTLSQFNLGTNAHENLVNLLKKNAFQMSNNFILFNKWNIVDTKLYSEIKLFSLNNKYEVALQEGHKIFQDDLIKISKDTKLELNEKVIDFKLAYKKDGYRFKIYVEDFKEIGQKNINELCKDKNEDCVVDVQQEIERKVNELNYVILNLQKYSAFLQGSMATCGNSKFTFIGNEWKKAIVTERELNPEKWLVFIDDKFVLKREDSQSSIKLYDQRKNKSEKEILDLEVKNITQLFDRYPAYLIYQTENEDLKVIFYEFFDNEVIRKFTLPRGETLSLMSSYNTLITHPRSNDNESLTLHLRQLRDIKTNLPNPVIKKLTVNFDNDYKRITGYDYDLSSAKVIGNIVYYEKTYVIPGNKKSSHGWIEESKNIVGDKNSVKKIYDGQGNLSKIDRKEQSSNFEEYATGEIEDINSVLFDITGNLEVAQFYPYEMKDDEVGYYGFEDYEVNTIGTTNFVNEKRWYFDNSGVVKQEFALTGQNYLNLKNNRLMGIFQPRNQNQNYVASCWVRSQGASLRIGTIAPYLKAVVYAEDNREINGYFSQVKFQYDDWSYLEVVTDLLYSKQIFNDLVSSTDTAPNEKPFKIVLTVSPDPNNNLNVDHIRFSPLNSNFQARIYNLQTKEIKEVINSNGLIKRYLYNDYQDQIVSIDGNGQIEKLNSYTKAPSNERIVNLKSLVQIQPNGGFHEDFNPHSFIKRWKVENDRSWKIAPSEMYHLTNQFDQLKLRNMHATLESYGMRLYFSLQSDESVIRFNDVLELERKGNSASITLSKKTRSIPTQGEILLITERNRLMVWINGGLYFDEGSLDKLLFVIKIYGKVKIRDVLVLFEPNVHVTYFNALGEKVQDINLESANSAILTEYLYDEVGRQCVTTKPTRLQRSVDEPIVAYYPDFVINKNPFSSDSVWKLGRIQGAFESLEPYNFYQITYNHNPLNENLAIGFPGQEFSVQGKFAKRFSSTTKNKFIKKNYPVDQNYRYYVEYKLDGIEDIKVFDNKNNIVAMLIKAPGKKDVLATYKYNEQGKLIQMLPPAYHNTKGTHQKGSQLQDFSKEDSEQHNSLSFTNSYDKMGNVITKTAPDSGKVEYLYNDDGQLKFNIFYSSFNNTAIENVVYFDYDHLGRLTNTGKLISFPSKEELLNLTLTKQNTEEYQLFYHSDFEREPTLRGRLIRSITHNDGTPFIEESLLNEGKRILSKRIVVLNENSNDDLIIVTNKMYRAGKVTEIEYAADIESDPFKVTYSYDKLGRIEGIGIPGKKNLFVKYTYNSNGLIGTEHHLPGKVNCNFTRKYYYNSASYLTRLEDKFLTENVYYTEGSYGSRGFGDGTIARTEFEASWHQYADGGKISLNEQSFTSKDVKPEKSKLCFNKLKSAGYINQYNRQAKIYYPLLEVDFPRICSAGTSSRQIQSILGTQGFPSKYGHLYEYDTYEELIKAKYFVSEEIPEPLQPDTFAKKIAQINVTMSHDIWKILSSNGYVIEDRVIRNETLIDDPYFRPHGKKGHSLVRSTLLEDLKSINSNYRRYRWPLEKALTYYFSKKQDIQSIKSNLKKLLSEWSGKRKNKKEVQESLQNDENVIVKMLEKKGYLQNPLDNKLNNLLENYQFAVPEIVEVLLEHFSKELGEAEFDVEAYEVDESGNHRHFYNGFERYELKYRSNSNQVETVNFRSYAFPKQVKVFAIKHDSRGNVIQALHKGIKNITYHPVSNRATSVELEDGKKIIFHYGAQGERVLKRVLDKTGEVRKEVHYVRDEFGRSLVEREITWSSPALPPSVLVTLFIYDDKGLIGFFRRDEYYSVITDHEGSIRLVVKDGEVVAAYDYLPYGNLMRQYATNSEAHISYRYTGHEWDEEMDLYNYHARFYDPSIGRFYQHDPKMQYFSPYKYAGNSPVSMIDPDGELGFMVIFVMATLGTVGAYAGGAAVSGSWNPGDWNFKEPKLYAGIAFGAIGGALIPVMLPASYAAFGALGFSYSTSVALTFGVGAVGVYAGAARSASEWNPAKWDFSRPELWNGGFTGFAEFATAPGAIFTGVSVYKSLPTIYSKGAFIAGSAVSGAGLLTLRLSGREYDFSKPDFYVDLLESIIFATDIPMATLGGYRFFKKNVGNVIEGIKFRRLQRSGYANLNEVRHLNSIWKSAIKFLVGVTIPILAGVFVSAAYNENGLDFTEPTTYEAFINGAIMASGVSSHAYSTYKQRGLARKQKVSKELIDLAQKSVDEYIKIIKDYKFPSEVYENKKIHEYLKAKKIPNTVLSAVKMKDGVVFMAYSGLRGPGFLSSFRLRGESHVTLANNKYIGYSPENPDIPRQVALNDDEIINRVILEALETKKQILKESNYKMYLEEKSDLNKVFTELLLPIDQHLVKSYFNEHEITNIVEEIGVTVQNVGYIRDKETMLKIIANPILRELEKVNKQILSSVSKSLKKIRLAQKDYKAQLSKVEKQIADIEQQIGIPEIKIDGYEDFEAVKNLLNDRLQKIRTKHDELNSDLNDLREAKEDDKNVWNELLKNYFKKYSEKFVAWEPINCAEPHVISLFMRSSQIFPAHVRAKYTVNDIKYLAAYKVVQTREVPELLPMERCSNCQETTRSVTNVITDPAWVELMQKESDNLKYLPKSHFYPYYHIITVHASHKGEEKHNRKKRSTSVNYLDDHDPLISVTNDRGIVSENYGNYSNYVKNDKYINKEQKKNVATNLFSWMKTSFNQLFNSKKFLPEKVSISHALKGITDSSTNLTTTAVVDVNSTILLVDTLMRKITGQKYISEVADDNTTLLEARGYSLDVGLVFQKSIKYAASKSGISMHRLNIHYMDIQDKVIDKIMSGRLDEIADILISHVEKACPLREKGCPGKLSPKKFNKFILLFSKRIDAELN